ncbi:uncharacterized protein BYT42DRAFT_576698 [Radiomyces spectabilis]|uniref:uncharacterized protein n=1 Tax=Radiomyces spectabilis TaxID=64574 RepID=UPI002220AC6C|nr:uncharacterized protein BYT42DRAFT_576698 [Radiomyces spectabilis]KAI8374537.1 hypothetical protein BYT42DRAFT_576698 [Radiomyces spectabilis]
MPSRQNSVDTTPPSDPSAIRESKRRRVDTDVDDSGSLSVEDSETESVNEHMPVAPMTVGEDGFVEGSIVKIILRNFVTYDYCEFHPGPQLNMIIGPNGTGKSTIVCAIALGLGGSTSLLGRAKNIAEFVKTGENEAMIRIELKKTTGPNLVIQRNIQKANNATSWRMNNRQTSLKEVLSAIARLHIQVDNLCQFLPQDKVAEFAQLSPSQLLERTQTAAGEHNLTDWHQQLIVHRQKQKELVKTHESDENHLKTLEGRNADLERDILRMRQREAIMKTIALLKAKLPLAKYSDAKKNYEDMREQLDAKQTELRRLEAELAPVQEAVTACDRDAKQASNEMNSLKASVNEHERKLKKVYDTFEKSKTDTRSIKSQINNVKRREQQRQEEMASLEEKIARLQSKLGREPPTEDTSALDDEITALNQQLSNLQGQFQDLQEEYNTLTRQKNAKQKEVDEKLREQKNLMDVMQMRARKLARNNADTYEAWKWLRENRNMFRGRIHGPLLMQLNLKDRRYADAVESALGGEKGSHLRTFVCEYKEDYELFTREAVDKKGWRLTVSWPDQLDPNGVKPPISDEELKQRFGLDHFIVNLVDAPPIVISYLCLQAKIHLIPVSLQTVDEARMSNCGLFQRYIMGDNTYIVKRYSYGSGGNQTTVRKIERATVLNDSLDNDARQRIQNELQACRAEISSMDSGFQELLSKKERLTSREHELRRVKEEKREEKKEKQKVRLNWNRAKMQLESYQEDREARLRKPQDDREQIEELEQQILDQAKQRANLTAKYKELLADYVSLVLKRNVTSIKALQSHLKLGHLKSFSRTQLTTLESARLAYSQAQRECQALKDKALRFYEEAQQAGNELIDEFAEEFNEVFEAWKREGLSQTQVEIEDAINAEQAKVDALKLANPRAMEQYETRMAEIRRLKKKAEADKRQLETLEKEITDVKSQWEPRLVTLVARISEKFSQALQRIGCAGEVCVSRDDDFDKWGIEIRVKFRDHEKLQLLTGQRQSGGERAVSTILYLMSLQELARAPFRVVDEINQGMDPRNERMIHKQIVEDASKAGTAQYFLITPKLLPDLYYNERMRVLCIYNGEWQPKNLKPASEYLRRARTAAAV